MEPDRLPPLTLAHVRLIAAAILFGALAFAVVVPVVLSQNEGKGLAAEPVPALDWIGAATAAVLAVLAVSLRSQLLRHGAGDSEETRRAAQARAALVTMALLEGGMLLNCIVWLLDGNELPSAAAFTALFLLAVALFPRE